MTTATNPNNFLATGSAPGKIILFGEHAVVYDRPAIAAPVSHVRAHAWIYPDRVCRVEAVDIQYTVMVAEAPVYDPFARIVRLICSELGRSLPPWRIVVHSDIPIASGLGSGAAIATAIARALLQAFDAQLPLSVLSRCVYEVEKLHHGTPSGIDNTVVVYEQPVWFVRGQRPLTFSVGAPLHFIVADTGIASPTKVAVAKVRQAWQAETRRYETIFNQIGSITKRARQAIEAGARRTLGQLMRQNQALLAEIGVSSPELEALCRTAYQAGALGAKLSGGGLGGNIIALAEPDKVKPVADALAAQAKRVIHTELYPSNQSATT